MDIFEYAIAEVRGKFEKGGCQLYFRLTTFEKQGQKILRKHGEAKPLKDEFYDFVETEIWQRTPDKDVIQEEVNERISDPSSLVTNRTVQRTRKTTREQSRERTIETLDISITDLTGAIGIFLAELGYEGWEVVDFKTASTDIPFSQALLKRRINK